MLSFQMPGKGSAAGDVAWLKGKLGYINEAFMTEFSSPGQASFFVKTYEDDVALQRDMPLDFFVELHEKGDACVIIDRFVVLDRNAYIQAQSQKTASQAPCFRLRDTAFTIAASF